MSPDSPRFLFGEFELDERLCQLRRQDIPVALQPKPLRLLSYLIRHRDRVVSKDEILAELWPEVAVSESALSSALRDLRRGLGDNGASPLWIETLRGRGYRFIGTVGEPKGADPRPTTTPTGHLFVGREQVLGELQGALADALAGRGQILLLHGEPGIGKTHTAEWLAHHARAQGVPVHLAWCYEREGAPPYWPWIQVMREAVAARDDRTIRSALGASAPDLAQLVPELRTRWPDVASPPPLHPDEARFRLFDGVSTFLRCVGGDGALVVILDDLHSADASSLRLLEFLARDIARSRVLVVGTYRDVEVHADHPLGDTLAELARHGLGRRIQLEGLHPGEVLELVRGLVGGAPSEQTLDAVLAKTDGNPLFIRELVRYLAPHAATSPGSSPGTVPPGVRDVIRGRLGRLSPACQQALAVASVIGCEFDLRTVARVCRETPDVIGDEIQAAYRASLVRSSGGHRHRFTHALIQEALYAELPPARRAELHQSVGESLEAQHASDLQAHLPELAHHFAEAAVRGAVEKAVRYAEQAGRRATELLAFEEAEAHVLRALEALASTTTPDPARRCELLLSLGRARDGCARRGDARRAYADAVTIARDLDDGALFARAADGFAGQPHVYLDPAGLELLEEALAKCEPEDTPLRVRILVRLAGHLFWSFRHERVTALADEALERARRIGDPSTTALTQATRAYLLWGRGTPEERLAIAAEATRLADEAGDHPTAVWGQFNRVRAWLELGDVEASDRDFTDLARRVRERRALWVEHGVVGYQSMRALLAGRFEEAELYNTEALELGQKVEFESAILAFGARLGVLRREQGRLAEIEGLFHGVTQGTAVIDSGWRCATTLLLAEIGRHDAARAEIEQLYDHDADNLRNDPEWMVGVACLSEACVLVGDLERAADLYERLLPFARLNVVLGEAQVYIGAVSHYLGIVAASGAEVPGRLDAAVKHLEVAYDMHRRMGAEPWVARTGFSLAEALRSRGHGNDDERVVAVASAAKEIARRLDMKALLERYDGTGLDEPLRRAAVANRD